MGLGIHQASPRYRHGNITNMENPDRISGTRLLKEFEQLHKDRTMLKLNLLGKQNLYMFDRDIMSMRGSGEEAAE